MGVKAESHQNPFLFLLNRIIFNLYLFCNLNFFSLSDIFLGHINFSGEKDAKYPFYHVSLFFCIFCKVSLSPLLPSLQLCKAIEWRCSLSLVYMFTLQHLLEKKNFFWGKDASFRLWCVHYYSLSTLNTIGWNMYSYWKAEIFFKNSVLPLLTF